MLTFMGLILRENDRGETSKSVTVLTAERGVIDIFVRGGRKSTKMRHQRSFLHTLSCALRKRRTLKTNQCFFSIAVNQRSFFTTSGSTLKKTALASYFSELLMYIRTEESGCDEIMRLTLNTLYFLDKGDRDNELLKSIFEFRLLCEAGLRPALLGCSVCMAYEADIMHFNLSTGVLECDKCCYNPDSIYDIELDRTMLIHSPIYCTDGI